jgi:hypothetical protein
MFSEKVDGISFNEDYIRLLKPKPYRPQEDIVEEPTINNIEQKSDIYLPILLQLFQNVTNITKEVLESQLTKIYK